MLRPYTCFPPVKRGAVALLVAACAGAVPAPAQMRASLGLGVGTVRTEKRDTNFSSVSLSPAVRFATPAFFGQASGFVASLPGGVWARHGRLYLWGATPRVAG